MQHTTHASEQQPQTNEQGFMLEFDHWNRDVAEAMAAREGLQLTDCHWTAIEFLRDYYKDYEMPPSPRIVMNAIGERLGRDGRCSRKELESMFPDGGCKQACRIAGLPRHYCNAC